MRHYISFSGPGGRHYLQSKRNRRWFGDLPVAVDSTGGSCPLCRRNCPLSEPGCENGQRFAAGPADSGE